MRKVLILITVALLLSLGGFYILHRGNPVTSTPSNEPWILLSFSVKVEPSTNPGSSIDEQPVQIDVSAMAQNTSDTTLKKAKITVKLPEDTQYVRGIGMAVTELLEVGPGKSIPVSYQNKSKYGVNFKEAIPPDQLNKHIMANSVIEVTWDQNGHSHSQVLYGKGDSR